MDACRFKLGLGSCPSKVSIVKVNSANLNQSVNNNDNNNNNEIIGFILMSSSLSDPSCKCLTAADTCFILFVCFKHDLCSKIKLENVKVITSVKTHNHPLFFSECGQAFHRFWFHLIQLKRVGVELHYVMRRLFIVF